MASHERAARLALLLDALAEQTLARGRWEVVVAHTYGQGTAAGLFEDHELTRAGLLRTIAVDRARARPSIQRNAGWRAARGALVAFTDDDCRPAPDWLERLVARAAGNPGAIVQGATRADPRDEHEFRRLFVRSLHVDPPSRFVQTCNVLYERALLERVGGFDERAITGEDIELAARARHAGAAVVAAPEALVYHAVEGMSLREKIAAQVKWQHLAYVVKRHPELRVDCDLGVWWKREHLGAAIALAGVAAAPRRPWAATAFVAFAWVDRHRHGYGRRAQLRALCESPAHWVVELIEIGIFARGSARYRTLLL